MERSGSAGGGQKKSARRDFEALQQRRMRAARMFDRGERQVDVVRELGVSAQTASRWYRAWQEGGRAALSRVGQAGRPRGLSDAQLRRVEKALLRGPKANGYPTDMWTLARVAEVIEKVYRLARYATHTVDAGMRDRARSALRQLRAELAREPVMGTNR